MIGADYVYNFLLNHVVRGEQPLSPVAILTRFGFVLSGPVQIPAHNTCSSNVTVAHVLNIGAVIQDSSVDVNERLKTFWQCENLGVKDDKTPLQFGDLMKDKIKFDGERYEVSLPVNEERPVIPDNYVLAEKRLKSLLNRLKLKPEIFKQYNSVIKEQIACGVVEYATDDEISTGTTHYIPHSGVLKEDRKTTKVRVVYDASSKLAGEISLNECLHSGPNLLPLIFDVLLRFRLNKIALIGDLEKAFLHISINPDQRNLLRFLWIDDSDPENAKIVKLRFTRLAFGLTCSPYILNATIRYHLREYPNSDLEFAKHVSNSLYVDDYASSFNSEVEAFEMYRKLKETCKNGGFNMRKWGSNCPGLLAKIDVAENSLQNNSQNVNNSAESNESNDTKVLGVLWEQKSDKLSFDLSVITDNVTPERVTKRTILSRIARFYDPLGLLSPVIVPLKQIFQEVCKIKTNWDVKLPKEICDRWCAIMSDIKRKTLIKIDRCILPELSLADIKVIELHGFADASKVGYGGVVYVRFAAPQVTAVRLIAAKSKLAPLKGETTPRLELKAALVLAHLIISVKDAIQQCLKIENLFCWSDSNVVLYWIHNECKKQKTFVENRLRKIRNLVNKENWSYCPTHNNPADIVSRGTSVSKLTESSLWWEGPDYLKTEKMHWPIFEGATQERQTPDSEKPVVVLMSNSSKVSDLNAVIPCENYSSFDKLIRVTVLVLKFVKLLRREILKEKNLELFPSDLSNEARNLWYKEAQKSFVEDKNFDKTKSNLNVFTDSKGILCSKGRIDNAPLPYETKFPVLLLKSHDIVKHNGVQETLTQVRSEHWIIRGRQLVKSILSKCSTCKQITGKPYDSPSAPPLPPFRVSDDAAFSQIGVDFAGPLYVRDIYSKTKQSHKCYIALFSCASHSSLTFRTRYRSPR